MCPGMGTARLTQRHARTTTFALCYSNRGVCALGAWTCAAGMGHLCDGFSRPRRISDREKDKEQRQV
jgi:hypothetical protein